MLRASCSSSAGWVCALAFALALWHGPEPTTAGQANVSYTEAKPVLESLQENLLPPELRAEDAREAAWPAWVVRRDADIRARVQSGDEESIVNFLLFGTTFTARPRATERDIARLGGASARSALVEGRIQDLVAAAALPGGNARLQFAAETLLRHGAVPGTVEGAQRATRLLREWLDRMSADIARIDGAVREARSLGDPAAEQIERATLFRSRGLASDTSIFSNFAVERALNGLRATGTLDAGSVRRVAIAGPGLDFVDKRDGFDFYPEQTVQPFAVIDSLLRHGLATLDDLRVTTFDVNPRINAHLSKARANAEAGQPYMLTLARDLDLPWTEPVVEYWKAFGDRLGDTVEGPDAPPAAGRVQVRTLRIRPDVVSTLVPRDLNVVLQRVEPERPDEAFDLIVATDILIYYGVFEQSLALANVAKMLRPGGVFLSNVRLVELPVVPIGSIGFNDAVYLTEPEIGDRVIWYRRQ